MARKPILGARSLVRILAVVLLLSGLAAGVVIGIQQQPSESLSMQSASEAKSERADNISVTLASDTYTPQHRPAGAELKMAQEESALSRQAEAEAEAKAEKINKALAERAEAAAKATEDRIREAWEGALPDIPADCQTYTGARAIGCALLVIVGLGDDQMSCLDKLWTKESHWNPRARNPSGAYGIPQALPGRKMASYGDDWETNPLPQIKWGLNYIKSRYGSPCSAWSHSQSTDWY